MINKLLDAETKVGDIFPNNPSKAKKVYKDLLKKYHPDNCSNPEAASAIKSLQDLYTKAEKLFAEGTWEKSNYRELQTIANRYIQINYQYHYVFELGEYFVGDNFVAYLFDKSKKKYYENYKLHIEKIATSANAPNEKMEKYFKTVFPSIVMERELKNNQYLIIIEKTPDVYPLRCVIENYFNGDVPDKHLAWMITRLLNICCFFRCNSIVCNGINLDNCFVSLDFHSILLLGGLWYATEPKEKMIGTSSDIYAIMPPKVKSNKISDYVTDIESIKSFGRKYVSAKAPKYFKDFLDSGSVEDAVIELDKWITALEKSYGKRKFIEIKAKKSDIYKKGRK